MNSEVYPELLQSLEFVDPTVTKKLRHREREVPTMYFNHNQAGLVYFTTYLRDKGMFPDDLWEIFERQVKKKDRDPKFRNIVPKQSMESRAFSALVDHAPAYAH